MKTHQLLSGLLMLGLFIPFANADFTDSQNILYTDAVEFFKQNGQIQGYEDGTFKPKNLVNRAEFLKMLDSVFDMKADAYDCHYENFEKHKEIHQSQYGRTYYTDITYSFSDVPYGVWYEQSLCEAVYNGYIEGYPDGTFGPNNNIQLAEAAKIVVLSALKTYKHDYRLLALPKNPDDEWFEPYIAYLDRLLAIPFTVDGPTHQLTREEVVALMFALTPTNAQNAAHAAEQREPEFYKKLRQDYYSGALR